MSRPGRGEGARRPEPQTGDQAAEGIVMWKTIFGAAALTLALTFTPAAQAGYHDNHYYHHWSSHHSSHHSHYVWHHS